MYKFPGKKAKYSNFSIKPARLERFTGSSCIFRKNLFL